MGSQGFPPPLRLCALYFLLLMLSMSNEKFKSGVSCLETLESKVSDFETNDHLQMVTKAPSVPPPPPPRHPFTHYIFASQWAPSLCMAKTCDRDKLPAPRQFTIHGLWPNTRATRCSDEKFEYLKLSRDTRDRLDRAWPGLLRNDGGQQQFLGHEWTDHGTCSGLSQEVYFKTALDLHTSVNVQSRLRDIRVVPGPNNKYSPPEIITAYENRWGLTIKIKCLKKRVTREDMIGEIHFRVNKATFAVESITGWTTSDCTPDTQALFPDKFPS